MSMFLGGQALFQVVDPEKIKLAEVQYTAQSVMFNLIMEKCNQKCIAREYGEGDLNTGEQSCLDRCVLKFMLANQLVGKSLQYNRQFNIEKMPEYQKVKQMAEKR